MNLCDVVELTVNVPANNLLSGYQGTIVHCHDDNTFEVEFINDLGETTHLVTLQPHQFVVVWQAETEEWIPVTEKINTVINQLPEAARQEVWAFTRQLLSSQMTANSLNQ